MAFASRYAFGLLGALLVLAGTPASAATYYLSQSEGNDTNAGTSPAAPWRNLARLNSANLQAGDEVLLQRDNIWRETLAIRDSGQPGNRLQFGAYGSGDTPLILGTDRYTEISSPGNDRHEVFTGDPPELFVLNGIPGDRKQSDSGLLEEGDWFWEAGVLRFRAAQRPDAVEIATRQFGIVFENVSHVTVRDLRVQWAYDPVWLANTRTVVLDSVTISEGAGFGGIFLTANDPAYGFANTIRRCTVERQNASVASAMFGNSGTGIFIFGTGSSDDNVVEECIVRDCRHEGIGVIDGKRNVIARNSVSGCGSAGIRLAKEQCEENVIEYNEVFENCGTQDDRFGIDLIIVGDDNIVRFNYVHEQREVPTGEFKSGGIRFDGGDFSDSENQTSEGNIAYYNLVYDEYVGINVFNASNVRVFNNTVVDCTGFGIAVHAVSTQVPSGNSVINNLVKMNVEVPFFVNAVSDTTIDHNLYSANDNVYFFAHGSILDFTGWQSTRAYDLDGTFAEPAFVDAAALDFRLQPDSEAVDAGRNLGLTVDFAGALVPSGGAVDIGAFEHTDSVAVEGEAAPPQEGEGNPPMEGEGVTDSGPHSADLNGDFAIELSELLRVLQLFQYDNYGCDPMGEDGYLPGGSDIDCPAHDADFDPEDRAISLAELMRVIQFFNAGGYGREEGTVDGFAPQS